MSVFVEFCDYIILLICSNSQQCLKLYMTVFAITQINLAKIWLQRKKTLTLHSQKRK